MTLPFDNEEGVSAFDLPFCVEGYYSLEDSHDDQEGIET
jgi:hypothetical protein